MYSLIVPVYMAEAGISDLLLAIKELSRKLSGLLEVVFVVDGSPDSSYELLDNSLQVGELNAQLLALSRNFGSYYAIRAGLSAANGKYFAIMSADMQEPPELVFEFFNVLADNKADVVIGARESRIDPWLSKILANTYWRLYKFFVMPDIPAGGVDVFGCNSEFREQILRLEESNASLISLIFWLGFRRKTIYYKRHKRRYGKSTWNFKKKLRYFQDSIFAFTNFPNELLLVVGALGVLISTLLGVIILIFKLLGWINVSNFYFSTVTIILFEAINIFGLGLVGNYAWRSYDNSKKRPLAIVTRSKVYQAIDTKDF
jgi:glycosyltransferase involved in cell wall biosynthesis